MLGAAVLNNALWCDTVCGHRGRFEPTIWLGPDVVPAYYPHAITLTTDTAAQAEILARGLGPGPRAVKDSFASHDLSSLGFGLLFEAMWIGREAGPIAPAAQWRRTADPEPSVARLEVLREGARIGSGILNFGAGVVGLSNVEGEDALAVSGTLVAAAAVLWPGAAVVGYEWGDALDAMKALGFEALGPLRVWTRLGPLSAG